jgi:CBS domain-containing protein
MAQLSFPSSDAAPARDLGTVGAPFLDRNPVIVRPDARVGDVLHMLLDRRAPGAAILDAEGRYTGACSLRRLIDRGLAVAAADAASGVRSLAYLTEDVERIRARLATRAEAPISTAMDPTVPIADTTCALPQALLLLYRGAPFLTVLEGRDGSLAGIVTVEGAMRAIAGASWRGAAAAQ